MVNGALSCTVNGNVERCEVSLNVAKLTFFFLFVGMSPSGFSQMDTEMQMDNEHLYAEQNDVSNLQIVGVL